MAQITRRITSAGETRYDVRTRIGGRVVTKTFKRRKDADAFASTVEADKLRGVVVDPSRSRATFETVSASWIAARTAKRASSIARDRAIIDHHLNPVIGLRAVGSISRADVQSLVDSWTGAQAPSTIGRQYSCLRAIFTWAETADRIMRNPCRNIRLPQVRLVARPPITAAQLARLATALGPDFGPMMWLGAVLGLRWGEAAGLTCDRVDISGGSVTVDRQLSRSGTLEEPKSAAGTRQLAAPQWLLGELEPLVARCAQTSMDGGGLLFTASGGEPLDYTNWRRRTWRPACETASLPNLRFHDLRSLAATALVAAGVDIKTAQTRLGHSSSQVTLGLYARATAKADRHAANAVGEVFRPRDGRAMQ